MSAKWVRAKRWEDQHLTGALRPVKWVLRAFSGVPLAVVLLTLVAIYSTLASVPVGLLALLLTRIVVGLTLLATVAMCAVLPTWLFARALKRGGAGRVARSVNWVGGLGALGTLSVFAWYALVYPRLSYNPLTKEGFRLFEGFVERYQSVQFRRLPGVEMSELEFYAWWPLTLVLVLFVINLIVATLRRIDFTIPRIGVLMVHTGIVTIALGSAVYASLKQEGDMVLLAGRPDEQGRMTPGPAENRFHDNNDVALFISAGGAQWEQRPIRTGIGGLPRYNDYNLGAIGAEPEIDPSFGERIADHGPLDIPVRRRAPVLPFVDPVATLDFRIIGYASYADLAGRVVPLDAPRENVEPAPLREVEVYLRRQDPDAPRPLDEPQTVYSLRPTKPAERTANLENVLSVEYSLGMSETRWRDLQEPIPGGHAHGLVVEVPGADGGTFRAAYAIDPGAQIDVGPTGYTIEVREVLPSEPFPIITPGYEGAHSSVAILRITPPATADATRPPTFDRYVYHRFPEISQDLIDPSGAAGAGATGADAMPMRRAADSAIRTSYIDASMVQVYLDEAVQGSARRLGSVRGMIRVPGGAVTVTPDLGESGEFAALPALTFKVARRAPDSVRVEVPRPIPLVQRENSRIGTHDLAAIALEVRDRATGETRRLWVPFTKFLDIDPSTYRSMTFAPALEGGKPRDVTVAFGRVRHVLPLRLSLKGFTMTPYPHSDVPQDYRSDVIVTTRGFEAGREVIRDSERSTSLNAPLLVRVPFAPRDDVFAPINWLGRLASTIIPVQYKFSQAGWDPETWRRTKAMAEAGELPAPLVRFTILGVGNNPGIYVIAAGAVLMSVGIPWAFYLKPVLVKRRKKALQRKLASEGRLPQRLMDELGLTGLSPEGRSERSAEVSR